MRPTGLIRWATDLLFSEGPKTGTVTKEVPDATIIARGHYPGRRWPAQWQNWFQNRLAGFFDHHDALEVFNWSPYELRGSVALTSNESPNGFVSTAGGTKTFWWIESEVHQTSTAAAHTWGQVTSGPFASPIATTFACGASARDTTVLAGSDQNFYVYVESTQQWSEESTVALQANSEWFAACSFGGDVYVGGAAVISFGVRVPRVFKVNGASQVITEVFEGGLITGFSPGCTITLMAASPTRIIAVAWDVDVNPAIWYSSDGNTWTETRPVLADTSFIGLDWDAANETFELFAIDGSIYTSTNGVAWTLRVAAPTPAPNALVGRGNTIAMNGGLWLAVNDGGFTNNTERVIYSIDRGVSWASLGNLWHGFDGHFDHTDQFIHLSYSGGRFWAALGPDTGGAQYGLIRSMRVKT